MPPPTPPTPPTIIIGLSGPSSSGKTTLARLLHRIFTLPPGETTPTPKFRSLLIHEDDFYHSDDKIPLTTLPTGTVLQNWDTAGALDLGFLAASLDYIRTHGRLPPRLRSKEDQNDTQPVDDTSTGAVGEEQVVEELRRRVQQRLGAGADAGTKTVAFMEGFLLFAPPCDTAAAAQHPLREVHERMDGRLFLPAAYEKVKERRERRSGYVTIGAAPVPEVAAAAAAAAAGEGEQQGNVSGDAVKADRESIDLEAEDDRPPQNFWTDPPGYVDDIVWPNYVKDHAWLLLPEGETEDEDRLLRESDPQVLVRLVGQGTRLRDNAGVTVAPGRGDKPITELLTWAVEEVLKHLEKTV
ncbi:hypothetical protein ASPACDRAFT_112506 [Aspergillus aculeatus ATCC 16872]|uniref:Phosphoribulokinase/uridine kinase domain-containing protein n=1 Tax=Aspergillus aculeatus (strain ATCC 16872 / CBS 172.66 / WB 5094) TaxID=690307 RepID=A0A1L9X744_ASPA1|nr:uncharacterized protein ASPACDRAFT_112506 [Aspergillus aculeatus ATCC 16872]OJK04149.1 hypothetical protein ASPACDRAFT_112506 [Aspergillus aculeatus ATCC 16872]